MTDRIDRLRGRLTSDTARDEWRANVRAAWKRLLETPVSELLDERAVLAALDASVEPQALDRVMAPSLTAALAVGEARMRQMGGSLGDLVPAEARESIDRLLEQPDVLPERFWREALENDAAEQIMHDVLYEALQEFSDKVNPFFAEWGLPSLLKKLTPFGLGGFQKALDGARAEFERRLDPEIRRFLKGFARRALKHAADTTIQRGGDPAFARIRKRVLSWMLERPLDELIPPPGDEKGELLRSAVVRIASHAAPHASVRAARRTVVRELAALHAKHTLAQALKSWGIEPEVDALTDAVADATWPLVRAVAKDDELLKWLDGLLAADAG